MFSFANPAYLYLLLLLPLAVLLFLWSRHTRKRRLNKYGKMASIAGLMPEVSKYKPWIKLTLSLLALAMVVIILARPRAGAKTATTKVRGIEVMIALDVSNSMRASSTDDPQGVSRLQRSKLILEKLIDRLGEDKVGLIVFAGNAYTQLPITSDFLSAKMYLSSINTNMVPTQGTAIGAAINLAMKSFTQNEKSGKSIIIITDGENHEDDAVGAAKEAHKRGIQINVIGVGSTKGAPIPMGGQGNFLKDDNGQVVTTFLNEQMAIDIGSQPALIRLSVAAPPMPPQPTEASFRRRPLTSPLNDDFGARSIPNTAPTENAPRAATKLRRLMVNRLCDMDLISLFAEKRGCEDRVPSSNIRLIAFPPMNLRTRRPVANATSLRSIVRQVLSCDWSVV